MNGTTCPPPAARAGGTPRAPATGPEPMMADRLSRTVVVRHPQGLHMRPAMVFAQKAAEFQCTVVVSRADRKADGKSLFELMFLAAEEGQELLLEVTGADAPQALDALACVLSAAEPCSPPKG